MTPTTYGRDFAYCLKSHGGVRGFNASLWRFLLRCTLFCHSVATFLTSVSSYEGGCGFEEIQNLTRLFEGTNANNANTFQSKKIMVGDKTIDIPLIALISHHYLAMDNVQIKFKAKVGSVESQIPENNLLLSSPQRANLQMQMSNIKPDADDVMEVCVNFKVQETPESISRIIDDFVKNI